MKYQSEYDKYLASLHAQMQTPNEIIREVIHEGTGTQLVSKEKIIAGEANEVYSVTLENKQQIILRISKQGYPNFLQEKWAIEQVKKVGVPAPQILFIKYLDIHNQNHSFCLMEKVKGDPLERGKIDFNQLSEEERKSYIIEAGGILSKIHSIKTSGFGWIIGEGKTGHRSPYQLIDQLLSRKESLYNITGNKNLINTALNIVDKFREYYIDLGFYLNHGDFAHKHFMVKDGKIVAILDWGSVRSDTPIADFAYFDYWFGEYIPTNWLKEGYQNKSLFDKDFDKSLHTLRIIKGIEIIEWYHLQNYTEAVEKAIRKLVLDVEYCR